MVTGQYPKREWRDNPDGQIRTIEEAVEIAKKHGVVIPDDITFHFDESGELHKDLNARGGPIPKSGRSWHLWQSGKARFSGKFDCTALYSGCGSYQSYLKPLV
jgi:hypothetical protein